MWSIMASHLAWQGTLRQAMLAPEFPARCGFVSSDHNLHSLLLPNPASSFFPSWVITGCVGGGANHPKLDDSPGGPRDWPKVILIALSYYREKTQSKIRTGKRHRGLNPEESRSKLPESSPKAITQDLFSSSSNGYNNTAKLMRDSVPKALIQDWSVRHPLPSRYQFQTPRMKAGLKNKMYCL